MELERAGWRSTPMEGELGGRKEGYFCKKTKSKKKRKNERQRAREGGEDACKSRKKKTKGSRLVDLRNA